jgi:hypothetical protein
LKALPCVIGGMGDPRLTTAVPGLIWDDGVLKVEASQFPCCAGRGSRLSEDGETTYLCTLNARLRAVRTAIAPYWREVPGAELHPLEGELKRLPAKAIERLAVIASGKVSKGLTFALSAGATPRSGPGGVGATPSKTVSPLASNPSDQVSIWAIAAAAAWRFNLSSHAVVIGRTPSSRLLPTEAPRIICVEHSDRPWDAPNADAFETLVGYAYAAMVPLFVLLPPGSAEEPRSAPRTGPRALKGAMAERVGRARDKSPLSWLAADARAKLLEVTDGMPKATARQAPKSGVPLPWDL